MPQTITFSEQSIGTVNPTFDVDGNTITTIGQIVQDGAQPDSPVIAANTSYTGPVFVYFDNPVESVSVDVGYFDNLGSTRIEFRNAYGVVVHSVNNVGFGVETFSYTDLTGLGISSVAAIDESFDAAGFSLDTVVFGDSVSQLEAPDIVSLFPLVSYETERDFGEISGSKTYFYSGSVGTSDESDIIRLDVAQDMTVSVSISLENFPGSAEILEIDLFEGANYLDIRSLDGYGSLEDYQILISTPDIVNQEDEYINDLLSSVVGVVFDYKSKQHEIFDIVLASAGNADEAAQFLSKLGKAFGFIGLALDVANRVDNIQAASNWQKQFFMEVTDLIVGTAATAAVGAGASFVGTPIAGILGSFATGIIYTTFISDDVKDAAGDVFDSLLAGNHDNALFAEVALLAQVQANDLNEIEVADQQSDIVDISDYQFDEDYYLAQYPEAAVAVADGQAISAIAYYLSVGIKNGHHINANQVAISPDELADGITIVNPANLYNSTLFVNEVGSVSNDGLSAIEVELADQINSVRTAGTEYNLNSNLSALANRIAQDKAFNDGNTIASFAQSEGALGWADVLSNGENYVSALADLANSVGVDLAGAQLLAVWGGGQSLSDIVSLMNNSAEGAQALVGLDNQSIGVANAGGVWVVLVTTQNLQSDAIVEEQNQQRIFGSEEAEYIVGSFQDDVVTTFQGDDEVVSGFGNDTIFSGAGDDIVDAGNGVDIIIDGLGSNILQGEGGHDTILSLSGLNTQSGGEGSDLLVGGIQADALNGGAGNDVIRGEASNGFLGGSDAITGGNGDDIMMGGRGADVFIFNTNDGNDVIGQFGLGDVVFDNVNGYSVAANGADFLTGVDHIQLAGFSTVDASNVMSSVTDGADGAVFSAEGTDITFYGVAATQLTADDFIFV